MSSEYERLILSLEPWLRGVLRNMWEKVPGAYYLKPLGNEAEANGGAEGEAADVRAKVMEKALSVARDIESGHRDPPASPEKYFKQVMRNVLKDWLDTQPETANLSSDERALIDSELYSIDKDEGDESFSALPPIHVPPRPRAPARPRRPFLLTLVRRRFWWKPAVSAEYERAQQLLDDIPNARRRQAVLLDLQGYRQEQIAARVFRTQQAVSKFLREQYAAWGWKRKKVRWVQYTMACANFRRLIWRVFDKEGSNTLHPPPRWDPRWAFYPEDSYVGEGFDEEEYDEEESYRFFERSFELPQEDEAYKRSRQSGMSLTQDLEEDYNQWRKPRSQQGSKERRISRSKAQDSMLYQAIMSDPALAPWTDGLELRHMPRLIAQVVDY